MGTKPKETSGMIGVLNSKTRQQLEEINILDRKTTILEIKKVLMKKNLLTKLKTNVKL